MSEPLTDEEIEALRANIGKACEVAGDPFPPPHGAGDDYGQFVAVGAASFKLHAAGPQLHGRMLATIDALRARAESAERDVDYQAELTEQGFEQRDTALGALTKLTERCRKSEAERDETIALLSEMRNRFAPFTERDTSLLDRIDAFLAAHPRTNDD